MADTSSTRPPPISMALLIIRSGWAKRSICGEISPEKRVGRPLRTTVAIRYGNQKLAANIFVQRRGLEVDGLVQIVRRCMVTIGEPVLEDFLLRRARFKTEIILHRRNSVADEVVLIAADKDVAQRFRIR